MGRRQNKRFQLESLDSSCDSQTAPWEDLPQDIGDMILDKLPEVVEHVRFSGVCKGWYMISKRYHQLVKSYRKALPMLLVPSPDAPAKRKPPRLFALSCVGKYYSNLQLQLPFRRKRYCGSSYGWIAFQNKDFTVTLVYPFGRESLTIQLPAPKHWVCKHCFRVDKLVISPKSSPDNYTVVVIYGGMKELATIKSGEESWAYIPPRRATLPASLFSDIVFFRGEVYAVSKNSMIVKVDVEARPPIVQLIRPLNRNRKTKIYKTYLVESTSSDLFLLQRRCDDSNLQKDLATIGFNVSILDEKGELRESKNINGDTFFVGDNTSIALQSDLGMSNSIYFTDDLHDSGYYKPNGPVDIGYYNVEDETVERCYKANSAHKKDSVFPPIWIVPSQHSTLF